MERGRTTSCPTGLTLLLVVGACGSPDPVPERVGGAVMERRQVEVEADDGHPLTVWVKDAPNPQGSLLLLHGRTWSALPNFDLRAKNGMLSLMDGLAELGYQVYALDARGYGGTPRDPSGWLTPDRMVEDVAAVLTWIEEGDDPPGDPALFGWSMGATVAHLTAQRHPTRLGGLILFGWWRDLDTPLPAEEPGEPERRRNTAEAAASDFIAPDAIQPEDVQAYVEAALEADPVRVDLGRVDQFNALDPSAVKVPTLLIQGELDPVAPDQVQAELFARLGASDKAWSVLGGCAHAAFLERCRGSFLQVIDFFMRGMLP